MTGEEAPDSAPPRAESQGRGREAPAGEISL